MSTPVTNFPKVQVSLGYDAAATSIVLTTGHGSRLPSTFPYPLSWWDATTYSDPTDDPNKEIVIVTTRVGDTLTVTRAGEGTSATTKNTAGKTYKMVEGITKAMWDELHTLSLSQSFRNLSLQTHYDSDKAASQVVLLHADAIVMDDGQEIKTWDLLTCDLTASGAGGIDTGTEQVSTWYKVHAIYNPSTETKKIMAHRAKDYFLDQDGSAGDDGSVLLRDAAARTKIAQGFKTTNAGLVEFIDVKIFKTAAPIGNFWFTIEANNAGVPSGTPLATSDKYDVSRLLTTLTMVRIPFRAPASLSAATQYHLVLQGDFTVSATNCMGWRADTSAPAYANGTAATFDGATWTSDAAKDFAFNLYVTRNDVAVTLPSGYTQKALIGYAYNDSGSDLYPFRQRNSRWSFSSLAVGPVVNETASTASLIDLRAWIPPVAMLNVTLGLTGTGAAAASCAVGDINNTECTNSVLSGIGLNLWCSSASEGFVDKGGSLILSYSALMIDASAGADLYLIGFDL